MEQRKEGWSFKSRLLCQLAKLKIAARHLKKMHWRILHDAPTFLTLYLNALTGKTDTFLVLFHADKPTAPLYGSLSLSPSSTQNSIEISPKASNDSLTPSNTTKMT